MDLATLFSAVESAKRTLSDTMQHPLLTAQQALGQAVDSGRDFTAKLDAAMPTSDPWGGGTPEARAAAIGAVLNGPGGFAPVGMLRAGGSPSLMASHSTGNLSSLLDATNRRNKGVAELYSPSFAVTKDKLNTDFGSTILIPRVGAFDPAAYTTTLFNRDAYTPRRSDFPGQPIGDFSDIGGVRQATEGAKDRLDDRFLATDNPRSFAAQEGGFGPFKTPTVAGSHLDAILASPLFRSFSQFERSPAGALTLGTERSPESAAGMLYNDAARRNWGQTLLSNNNFRSIIPFNKKVPEGLLTPDQARNYGAYRDAMSRIPSDYAELKASGPVPIIPEHFAGMLVPQAQWPGAHEAERSYADRVGLPIVEYNVRQPSFDLQKQLFEFAQMLQDQAGPARQTPIFPNR